MRIILAENNRLALLELKATFQENAEIEIIGEATDAADLLTLARNLPADLVLVDRELPGIPIRNLITSLHALNPRPIVIIMSSEFEYSRVLLKAGADAFVSNGDPDWLLEILDKYVERLNQGGKAEKINGTNTGNINPIY